MQGVIAKDRISESRTSHARGLGTGSTRWLLVDGNLDQREGENALIYLSRYGPLDRPGAIPNTSGFTFYLCRDRQAVDRRPAYGVGALPVSGSYRELNGRVVA
jgi:hypothetical protein